MIKDEEDRNVYSVSGQLFSFGHKLSFCDMSSRELVFIKQRLMTFSPTYEIYLNGQLYAIIKKELFTFFKCRFNIEVIGGIPLEVEGDFLDHEYDILMQGSSVARVSKKWFSFSDTYGIEVAPGQNDLIILSLAVAIDLMCHDNKNS
jgi:uncharacterized protein YxjI